MSVVSVVNDVPDAQLDAVVASGYGIFSARKCVATRHAPSAMGLAREWHPEVRLLRKDGSYEIDVPFTSTRSPMDILKFGPDVEVVSPASLRAEVAARAEETARKYR